MYKSMVTTLTAAEATETTKKLVDSVRVPQGIRNLIAVGAQVSTAGLTTLEDVTGIIELESDDMAPWTGTQQFLLNGMLTAVTSGAVALNPYMHPTNIPCTPGSTLKISVTFNKAQTVNPSVRAQLVFE